MKNVIELLIKEKEKIEKENLKAFEKEPKDYDIIIETELLLHEYETAIDILQNTDYKINIGL